MPRLYIARLAPSRCGCLIGARELGRARPARAAGMATPRPLQVADRRRPARVAESPMGDRRSSRTFRCTVSGAQCRPRVFPIVQCRGRDDPRALLRLLRGDQRASRGLLRAPLRAADASGRRRRAQRAQMSPGVVSFRRWTSGFDSRNPGDYVSMSVDLMARAAGAAALRGTRPTRPLTDDLPTLSA